MKSKDINVKNIALAAGGTILAGILFRSLFSTRKARVQVQTINLPVTPVGISPSEADVLAQGQFAAMNKMGTDDIDEMTAQLENLTANDLKKVFNAFGRPCYNGWTECVGIDRYLGGQDLNLFGWYNEELTDSEKEKMRAVWRKTGLQLTF